MVVAHDLSPGDTALLVKSGKAAGFVTDLGGQTSHTAIVARARETPAVVGAGRASEQISPGDLVAIVESYRTAKVAIPEMKERVLEVPVAGETTVIPAPLINRFLTDSGLSAYVRR